VRHGIGHYLAPACLFIKLKGVKIPSIYRCAFNLPPIKTKGDLDPMLHFDLVTSSLLGDAFLLARSVYFQLQTGLYDSHIFFYPEWN
jgi:hypothetical protein